jgi:hypothetical protein
MENINKVLFDQVKEYFKDAVQCVSVMGSKFNMKDYDLNSLHIDNGCVFIKNNNGEDDKLIYDLETKQYANIVTTTSKLKVSFNPRNDWLDDIIWSGGSSVTPDILRELTEPKNEPKRLKVGGIYKSIQTKKLFSSLFKITKDEGEEIRGYGFLDGKFIKEQILYTKDWREEAVPRQIEVSQKKWEKALLKYKK